MLANSELLNGYFPLNNNISRLAQEMHSAGHKKLNKTRETVSSRLENDRTMAVNGDAVIYDFHLKSASCGYKFTKYCTK